MAASEEALNQLEEHVVRAVRRLDALQRENDSLKAEIERLGTDLENARRENNGKDQLIRQLKDGRLRIRAGVERIMEKVTALEKSLV